MKDPVKLPTSGHTVDRGTIKRILLNDEHDPFNRAPLSISEIKDDVEMKQRIEKWLEQKRKGEVTDEEKKQEKMDEESKQLSMEIQKEEDSNMSVDPQINQKSLGGSQDVLMEKDFESMTEEEQLQYAMKMSMNQFN